jgi:hypothetical protein
MQKTRFTNEELQIIKQIFADSEDDKMLKILRKVFFQLPMDAVEMSIVKTTFYKQAGTMAAIRKMFLPDLDGNAPILQCGNAWSFFSPRIEDLDLDKAELQIKSRRNVIDYLRQQLDFLETEKDQHIVFTDFINAPGNVFDRENDETDSIYIGLIAHNFIINYVEQRLNEIKILAGRKDETPEETIQRLQQNSNK